MRDSPEGGAVIGAARSLPTACHRTGRLREGGRRRARSLEPLAFWASYDARTWLDALAFVRPAYGGDRCRPASTDARVPGRPSCRSGETGRRAGLKIP